MWLAENLKTYCRETFFLRDVSSALTYILATEEVLNAHKYSGKKDPSEIERTYNIRKQQTRFY